MLLDQSTAFTSTTSDPKLQWVNLLFDQLKSRFEKTPGDNRKFPCLFAQKAFSKSNLKFLLVPFDHETGRHRYDILAEGLAHFLRESAKWDGNINTAEPLLAIFEPTDSIRSTIDYQNAFTRGLQYLIDNDTHEWIGGIPQDPSTDFWTMCFSGTQIFINVSHPNNVNRLSRNLCDALVLVINPRERFDVVAGANTKGHRIREKIRKNVDAYDLIPHSQYLGHYQDGELEWPQYMLPDDNESEPMACPLKFHSPRGQ
jgi:uncharacterized protein